MGTPTAHVPATMRAYYEHHLAGARLLRCYRIARPRIQRYLDAEIRFASERLRGAGRVLELGCGYGRVMKPLSLVVREVAGCDIAQESLSLARSYLEPRRNVALVRANAVRLPFATGAFDATVCVQNGISAFGVDPRDLVAEAVRVTRTGGRILFSTYSARIWPERLEWFREQAREGLVGAIDEARTRDGTIVCTDGFRATTLGSKELARLFDGLVAETEVREVDGSSVFCVAVK